jgi:hypothetical protein
VLEHEIPKYDGDLGNPAFLGPLTSYNFAGRSKRSADTFPVSADEAGFPRRHSSRSPDCAASAATRPKGWRRPSTPEKLCSYFARNDAMNEVLRSILLTATFCLVKSLSGLRTTRLNPSQ